MKQKSENRPTNIPSFSVNIDGLMVQSIVGNLSAATVKEKGPILFPMDLPILESGPRDAIMVSVNVSGRTVASTRASGRMAKPMDMVWRSGPTAQYDMKACGIRIILFEKDERELCSNIVKI